MKFDRDKKLFLIMLTIGIAINIAAIAFYHSYDSSIRHQKEINQAEKVLEKLHANFSIESALGKTTSNFIKSYLKMGTEKGADFFISWKKTNRIPDNAVSLIKFKNGVVLNCPETEKNDWQLLLETINKSSAKRKELDQSQKNRLIKLLKGGVGYEMIEGRPSLLTMMNRGPERSYAIWNVLKEENNNESAAILFFHAGKLNDRFIARYLLDNCSKFRNRIAFLDLFNSEISIVPGLIKHSIEVLEEVKKYAVKNVSSKISIEEQDYYLIAKPNGKVLLCLLSPKQHALPLTGLAAMYFWIPLLFKQFLLTKKKGFYSLQNLMFLLILAGLILPAAGTASFWKNFIETKRQSLKIEHASKIEQSLFTLDEQHQTIVREHKFKFRYFNSILDGKLENLQEFIDESLRLELDMLIDTLLLVDAEGKFYRPYTGSLSIIRGLVMYPRPYRRMIVDEFLDMGWLPPKQELEYVLNADGVNFDKHFGLSTRTSKTIIRSLGKIAATEILQNYNQTHGYTQTSEKANLSAMVMGSFVDNFDESPGAIVSQNLADFVELGFGIYKSRNYVDVIRDKDGKAKFVSIIYASSNLTTLSFLKRLFSDTEKWPENVKYVAISERPMWLSFPCPDAWKRMNNLFNWLKPPRIVFTDEVYINKELHLRCSYVAQNCLNYIISGYMPMKVIENEVKNFKARLMAGGIILLTTLIFVIYRLRTVVLKPAEELVKGVNAIANKNLDFKIKLHTKDEWEQLGNTFNDAIEGVKELQMANFIQNCILPDKPITSENSFFIGKTVPADEVGGDYYEAFLCRNGLTFIMGDVSGHSVSAALVVSMADAAFNGLIDQGVQLPAEILSEMNRLMLENLRRIKMMTCFCGHISDDGVLTYSNAGQSFPMLITYEKTISLKQVGYPLGAAKKKKFKQERIDLPEFCRILMYSDGVIEAQNEAGELFGYERLEKIVNETGLQANCESFLDYLYTELKNFTGNVPWGDDVTLVLIEHKRES